MDTDTEFETATDVMRDAGFTLKQQIAIQRIVNRLVESDLKTQEQLSNLMERLKPEAWLS